MKRATVFLAGLLVLALMLGMTPVVADAPVTGFDVQPDNPLTGKRALFCGDSISQGAWDTLEATPNQAKTGWATRIGEAYGMTVDNVSVSGWSMSTIRSGRIVNQVKSKRGNTYDYVILHGGVNDAWGDTQTKVVAEPGEMSLSFNPDNFDVDTFAGGLEECLYYAVTYYPTAKVGYIMNFATPRATGIGRLTDMEDYYRVAKQICEKWGAAYLDLYHDHYVNEELLQVDTSICMHDSVHLNRKGYNMIAPYIGKWMETIADTAAYRADPLYQKTALFCGDSISYGSNDSTGGRAWAGRIGEARGMTADNRSVSGSSLSTVRSGRIVEQLQGAAKGVYDYVILHGGVNDAWESAPVGSVTDSFDKRDFDLTTYAGGLEELLCTAKELFPGARVGFIFNFALPRAVRYGRCSDMEEYVALGKQICEKWGVACLDLYHDAAVNDELLTVNDNRYMADAVHPNAAGYDRLAPYIGQWMETLVPWTVFARTQPADYSALDAAIAALPDLRMCTSQTADPVQAVIDAVDRDLTLAEQERVNGWLAELEEASIWLVFDADYGDVNADGAINASDALLVLQQSVRLIAMSPKQIACSDVNGDDAVNAADALLVLQYSVRLIRAFPVEDL